LSLQANIPSSRPSRRVRPLWFSALALLGLAACNSGGGDDHERERRADPPSSNPSRLVGPYDQLPGLRVDVQEVVRTRGTGALRPGDRAVVRYSATTTDGTYLNVGLLDGGLIMMSGPTNNYQRVIAPLDDLRERSVYEGEGVWRYEFAAPIPATYLAPYNDSEDLSDGELTGQNLLQGTYTVGIVLHATYRDRDGVEFVDAGNGTADFLIGEGGEIEPRAVVQSDNCNVCHTQLRMHEQVMRDVGLCVLCHTAGAEDSNVGGATPGQTIEFKVMIHKLHNGMHLPSVLGVTTDSSGNRVYPASAGAIVPLQYADDEGHVRDFSEVNFPVWPNFNVAMPRDRGYSLLSSTDPDGTGPLLSPRGNEDRMRMGITTCAKCHGDPDGAGPMTAPAQGTLHRAQPSRRACGSCHDDIDWAKPYVANGATMDPQADDSHCKECHQDAAANQSDPTLKSLSVAEAHVHPLLDPVTDAGVVTAVTAVGGGTFGGGNHQVGDPVTMTFTIKDDAGTDLPISSMDSAAGFFYGPSQNRQLVMPYTSTNGMSLNPFDFTGRLVSTSATNKGSMSKLRVGNTAVQEVLTVLFSSSTAFTITGTSSGALGSGTLPAATSTNPASSSISAIELGAGIAAGAITITFTSATHFVVAGAVSGEGDLPSATNGSTRFEVPNFACNLTVGATAFAASNVIRLLVVEADTANPVKFALVVGRTAFAANDRFYYEVMPTAPSYTVNMPMDLAYEFLADSTNTAGQVLPAAGNLPVYFGRQSLWEAATTATTTTTTTNVAKLGRRVEVAGSSGWANNDVVAVEPVGVLGVREYAQIAPVRSDGLIAAAGDTAVAFYFKTPLRYAHTAGATITKVTLTLKLEGTQYSLDATSGVVTAGAAFTASRAMVMSYRSHARFGYKRHSGDTVQANYVPAANDSDDIGQEQGDWNGLPYLAGTYTLDLWFYKNIDLGLQGEVQTYRSTSAAGERNFLFGAASVLEPRTVISTSANCYACHDDVIFHGGGRRGVEACLTCHGISGAEDKGRWDTATSSATGQPTALTPGVAIEFRQMLHKIHKGAELANAATYEVVGNGGNSSSYGEIEFPAWPGGTRQCARCHGNDAWKQPVERMHGAALWPVRTWGVVCGSCHDSIAAQAHLLVNTTGPGNESCAVCHGPGREYAVEKVHLPR
jgi:hypothetical protein